MKKILSILLSTIIIVSSFAVSWQVMANQDVVNVTLNRNGGKFANDIPETFEAGDDLPKFEDIERNGLVFAGWYDNSNFTGDSVTTVPTDATGDITYYAKWVKYQTVFDNFDDVTKTWSDNSGENKITTNDDGVNVFSGTKSMRCEIPSGNVAYVLTQSSFTVDGDGVGFWINTPKALSMELQINWDKSNIIKFSVPSGKSFVCIPWSMFGDDYIASLEWPLWAFYLFIKGASAGDVVYIDDVCTYSEMKNDISFELFNGKFVDTDAPFKYIGGMILPEYNSVSKGNLNFAGWYDNAELTGNVITTVPSDASGDLIYYAKWVRSKTVFDNFDDVTKTWSDNSGEGKITTNTDKSNALSGSNSMKCEIPSGNVAYILSTSSFEIDGDGVGFWIDTLKALNIELQINYNSASSGKINVPKGESFVFIPWSKFGEDYISSLEWPLWAFQIIVKGAKSGDIVYIDDVGTYYGYNDENISFNKNGGTFSNDEPTKYYPGMELPSCRAIVNDNLIFAGWYDNAELTGDVLTTVPSDASGDLTYYAKWVRSKTVFDNFDDVTKTWSDNSGEGKITTNTDKSNAFSGSNSMKCEIPSGNVAYIFTSDSFTVDGDGVAFWIKTSKSLNIELQINYNAASSGKINVPKGESFVFIPWSKFGEDYISSLEWPLWAFQIIVKGAKSGDIVYIDDIGTYSEFGGNISFELNGAQFVGEAPTNYKSGMILPSAKDVTKDGSIFAGWYDNAEFTGNVITTVPSDAADDLIYYAKWVRTKTVFDNFDDVTKTWRDNSGEGKITTNTDNANAYSGSKSMKCEIPSSDTAYIFTSDSFTVDGEGIAFWIKTPKSLNIELQINYNSASSGNINVSKGESFVFIPWSKFGEDYISSLEWPLWAFQIIVKGAKSGDIVYIDDVVTYSESIGNISFELNGGSIIGEIPTEYGQGMILPNVSSVNRNGFIFAGWYDNADFKGSPVYVVANDKTGDLIYYAKWVFQNKIFENADDEEFHKTWNDYSTGEKLTPNEDSENSYSGKFALKHTTINNSWNGFATTDKFEITGDGISFWVKTPQRIKLSVTVNYNYKATVTVPNGESFVLIPWSTFGSDYNLGKNYLDCVYMSIPNLDGVNIYFDDIGTYSEIAGEISFEVNEGEFSNTAPIEYYQGMFLPSVKDITKNGFIFAGWYNDAELTGETIYSVPSDAKGDLTYYAKWVIQNEIFENADDEKGHKTWNDYSTGEKLTPNEDSENCYSGKFALKHITTNNSWNGFATTDKFEITGDGISFWIKTKQKITLNVTVNYKYKASDITITEGERFVFIPWSTFDSEYNLGKTYLDCVYINVPNLNGATVYFDDIGTYSEIKGNVSFELNGGQFVNTAPVEYYHGMFLPKYEDVTKNGLVFAGWYDNEKLEGNPVYSVPKNASGNIKYYAKWVVNVLNFEDFENGIKGWSNWGGENASMMLDKSNVQSGNNSLKYEVLKNLSWNPSLYIKKNLPIVGDGLCFWIKTEQADTIQLKFDHLTDVFTIEPIKLPKGESFVMIPWSQLGDKINDQDKLTEMEFILGKSKGSVYYIDSVGTYHSSTKFEINYNLNGGKFIDDSIVSFKTSATDNTVLPTFENIKRDGFYFAGWYEDKECTTTPIYLLSPSALGANLYAKWVEQDEINHNFDDFADTQDMCDDLDDDSDDYLWSNYREAYEGWRESGGANLYLNTDTNNTAPDSLKSLEVSYEVLGGGYVDAGEEPAALFGNNNWATTFGKRGSNKQGDGIRFWIKSDRTITLAVVFNKQGKSKPYYMPRITIPANVPVLVYQPWSALSNDGYNAFELPRLRFEIFDEIGATGKVWIDDLGVYYNEKIEDYVRVHKDGDVKVTSYNNHIPKNTITELEKYNINYLNKLGTKIPEGATANYIVKYSFKKPDGGLLVKSEYDTVLPGPAWISFKIPKGTDISKIGLYELLYEGSLMNVNYTIEGEWVTYYAINPNAILVLTTNDSSWTPKGGNLIQPNVVQSLKVETTIFIENEEYVDEQTDVNQQLPSDNTQISTGTRRPPKRTPLIVDDTQQLGWIVPAIICGSIAFLIAVGTIIIVICLKRRKNQEAQNNE